MRRTKKSKMEFCLVGGDISDKIKGKSFHAYGWEQI